MQERHPSVSALNVKPERTPEQTDFYHRLNQKGIAPLWESLADLVPLQPRPSAVPMHWSYEDIRPLLMEAGSVITAKQAERRVLMLENPGIAGGCLISDSLYAGLQLVLPGEIARTHRHSASALRFIIEGKGAYTSVEGERAYMRPGDFILTPSWTYHDHGNPSDEPIVWLDGLDVPIVNLLNTSFAEPYGQEIHPLVRRETDSLKRYGSNMAPLEYRCEKLAAPLFAYPYDRSRETLEWLSRNDPLDECHGFKMQYINPATGGYSMPTIAAFLQLLPAGFRGSKYRSTDATIFSVAEGRRCSHIGNRSFHWKEHDIFVVPSWYPVSHESETDSVLFSFSDRPLQKVLGLWREEAPMTG